MRTIRRLYQVMADIFDDSTLGGITSLFRIAACFVANRLRIAEQCSDRQLLGPGSPHNALVRAATSGYFFRCIRRPLDTSSKCDIDLR